MNGPHVHMGPIKMCRINVFSSSSFAGLQKPHLLAQIYDAVGVDEELRNSWFMYSHIILCISLLYFCVLSSATLVQGGSVLNNDESNSCSCMLVLHIYGAYTSVEICVQGGNLHMPVDAQASYLLIARSRQNRHRLWLHHLHDYRHHWNYPHDHHQNHPCLLFTTSNWQWSMMMTASTRMTRLKMTLCGRRRQRH